MGVRIGSSPAKTRSILLVAHLSPPSNFSAARRTAGLTKYLSKLGYSVTVITSILSGEGDIDGAERVVRTRDLLKSRINWRRTSLQSLSGQVDSNYQATPSRVASLVVPDVEAISWAPYALARALRILREKKIDCVITTAPPRSAHLVGLMLHARGIPWVADFRDGWSFDTSRVRHQFFLRGLDSALERLVTTKADRVVAVTSPIAHDIQTRFRVLAATITNGFDPDEYDVTANGKQSRLSTERYSLVHTGSLAYGDRSVRPILEAMQRLKDRESPVSGRLEVVFAGPLSADESQQLTHAGPCVRALGNLTRVEALELQRASDGLLLIAGNHPGVATGKLYEYLAARKPIVVLGEESAAASIVREVGSGLVASATDPDEIAKMLSKLLDDADHLRARAAGSEIDRFSYVEVAESMATEIEKACCRATS